MSATTLSQKYFNVCRQRHGAEDEFNDNPPTEKDDGLDAYRRTKKHICRSRLPRTKFHRPEFPPQTLSVGKRKMSMMTLSVNLSEPYSLSSPPSFRQEVVTVCHDQSYREKCPKQSRCPIICLRRVIQLFLTLLNSSVGHFQQSHSNSHPSSKW